MKKKKVWIIAIHLVAWLWFLAFPLVFLHAGNNTKTFNVLVHRSYWQFVICYSLIFYLNSIVFVPNFFLKKKYTSYTLIIAVLFVGLYYLKPFDRLLQDDQFNPRPQLTGFTDQGAPGKPGNELMPPLPIEKPYIADPAFKQPGVTTDHQYFHRPPNLQPPPHRPNAHFDVVSIFLFVMIVALSMAVEIGKQWGVTEQRAVAAEVGKANAELSFLKAQINPHFLFNTLNNIYTLAVSGSKYTADSIMKLSNIMRYVTDEVSEDFVELEHEIECIENYIDLQRLRLGKQTKIVYIVAGDIDNKVIPPLVLMTFIENVFKYGISKKTGSQLTIQISLSEHSIRLYCQNPIHKFITEARNGIGIENTRQRLLFLYPGKHTLNIIDSGQTYTVELILYT